MRFVILDVGHGNSAVISDDENAVVIDAGTKSHLLEYLKSSNITQIDAVLISHADQDHISGLLALLACKSLTIKRVRLNTDSIKDTQMWDDLLYELDEQDKENKVDFQVSLVSGSREDFSIGKLQVEVLAPNKYLAGKGPGSRDRDNNKITTNTISAVVKILHDDKAIALLPGDLDSVGLNHVLSDSQDIQASTLVYPHHGGGSGDADAATFADQLFNAVSPENVIFSIGRGRYGTPKPEIVQMIKKKEGGVLLMCTQLSKHCSPESPMASTDHIGTIYSQGIEKKACCAGSIEISIDDGSIIIPSIKLHQKYIATSVPSPLCK